MVKTRYGHSLSLDQAQEEALIAVRKKTGYSIIKMLMATVDALNKNDVIEKEND